MQAATGVTEIRQRQGMTISHLATTAGVSRVTIYAVERGEPATLDTLIAIARALGVSLAEISPEAGAVVEEVA